MGWSVTMHPVVYVALLSFKNEKGYVQMWLNCSLKFLPLTSSSLGGLNPHLPDSEMPTRWSMRNISSIINTLKEIQLLKSNIGYCALLFFQESQITDEQSGVIVTISCLLNRVTQSLD